MTDDRPVFNQVNLITRDIDATIAFYRLLGLPVADAGGDWPPGSGARHVEVEMGNGMTLEFDNRNSAAAWYGGVRDDADAAPTAVMGFALASRDAVDAVYAQLVAGGARSRQQPYDAFWGSRYAVVADPDGNDVGLMSPMDPTTRSTPSS